MARLWPWSSGAPSDEEHSPLEEEMGPDTNRESDFYGRREEGKSRPTHKSQVTKEHPPAK